MKWETSADRADVDNTEFDFRSTMYHELNHALGFGSAILQNGLDIYNTLVGNPGTWDLFDKFISDVNGTAIIDPATFILNGPAWNQHSEGGASPGAGLFFNGEAAVAANGGNPVGLYTPTTWEDGSSVSHTDDENSAFNNSMMIANTDNGPGSRDMSAIEIGIMKDLGYDVVPLPSAIMLLGPALFGLAMIRRRKK